MFVFRSFVKKTALLVAATCFQNVLLASDLTVADYQIVASRESFSYGSVGSSRFSIIYTGSDKNYDDIRKTFGSLKKDGHTQLLSIYLESYPIDNRLIIYYYHPANRASEPVSKIKGALQTLAQTQYGYQSSHTPGSDSETINRTELKICFQQTNSDSLTKFVKDAAKSLKFPEELKNILLELVAVQKEKTTDVKQEDSR